MSEADITEMDSMREVGIDMPKIFGLAGHLSRGTKGCGTSAVVRGKKKKIRKCGSCRQDGHNIRSCPVEALKWNFTQTSEESESEGVPYSEDDGG
ncbi:hypothetical protein RIF29_11262 [Crotalaria pallida]|uniref:Uncharacterized protein n=1 Tax=Crotalaria pallida TaxID=3830 RepID=A0AAN9ILY3_CROPI